MIPTIIGIMLFVGALCFLFTVVGYVLWSKTKVAHSANFAFTFGASFFLGISIFVTIFSLAQVALGAKEAFFLAVIFFIIIALTWSGWHKLWRNHKIQLSIFSVVGSAFFLVEIVHALVPLPRIVLDAVHAPYAYGLGAVVHSFRAENIALAIVENNALPFINQNSGQAILASMPHLVGLNMPQFSLLVWHAFVLIMVTIFVWGIARSLLSARLAVIPTILVLAGNTALSYRYISVTDTGHSLLQSQNYETVIGLAGLSLAILVFRSLILNGVTAMRLIVLGILVMSWSVFGAHLTLILLSVGGMIFLINREYKTTWKAFSQSTLTVFIGMIVGTLMIGGMFSFHAPSSDIPGVKSVSESDKSMIELRWFRTIEAEFHSTLKTVYLLKALRGDTVANEVITPLDTAVEPIDDPAITIDSVVAPTMYTKLQLFIRDLKQNENVWRVVRVVRSVQLVFLPLIGLVIGYWILRKRPNLVQPWFREFYILTLPLFLVGWLIASTIFMYGQYGELSRFFAPGITASLFLLGVVLTVLIKNKNKLVQYLAVVVVIISVVPVVSDYLLIGVVGNFVLPSTDFMRYESLGVGTPTSRDDILSIEERFDLLFSAGIIRGESSQ